jgi:hypothetical protein
MAYALDAEGNNGVNATTRVGNLDGFDFGVLLQLDGSQSDALSALAAAGGTEGTAIVARGGGGGVVGIIGELVPPNYTQPPISTIPNFQATGAGVLGITDATAVAVVEKAANNPANNFVAGLKGVSTAAVGVGGVSQSGTAVYATSNSGYGVDAFSAENIAVHAISTKSIGIYAQTGSNPFSTSGNEVPGFLAGLFMGPVQIAGSLTVFGSPKHAAVRVSDGSYRALYCMESPECWFEDFGEAQLIAGKSEIKLDAQFASVVKTRDYHVFLSPYGDCNGLYVSRRTARGFTVRELKKGLGKVRFSYRVVARRKDIEDERMPKVAYPVPPSAPPSAPSRRLRQQSEGVIGNSHTSDFDF